MSPTRLHFIRHGEAYSNILHEGKVVSGMRGDRGLTPHGVVQVERLRDRLLATGELASDVALASTLPRAWQTAEILAPVWDSPIIPDDDLHELRPWRNQPSVWTLLRYNDTSHLHDLVERV